MSDEKKVTIELTECLALDVKSGMLLHLEGTWSPVLGVAQVQTDSGEYDTHIWVRINGPIEEGTHVEICSPNRTVIVKWSGQ